MAVSVADPLHVIGGSYMDVDKVLISLGCDQSVNIYDVSEMYSY